MIHNFPKNFNFKSPERFTDPFRYVPDASVQTAAELVIRQIDSDPDLKAAFSEGKMVGILVCRREDSSLCYLQGFSGNIGGKSNVDGFVPPIYDLMAPDGEFKKREAEITSLNIRIKEALDANELKVLTEDLEKCWIERDTELGAMKAAMEISKQERAELRIIHKNESLISELNRKSQFEKAELKRKKTAWEAKISEIQSHLEKLQEKIDSMKLQRASMSEKLQGWIFRQYIVHNAEGQESTISEIFASHGLTAPGGTGECAAPKLLEYAFRNGLQPVAMGEFWYGRSSDTAVRVHGHFYPSCTSKCGPLLGYMLKGLTLLDNFTDIIEDPIVKYEDDSIIIVEKPSGMPSVPGLDGRLSLLEWLEKSYRRVLAVHRLDMDTSGLMIFAKSKEAESSLRKQFEDHQIKKTYMARLTPVHRDNNGQGWKPKGTIELPLSADYDERPRQKADFAQGKAALTRYETISENHDGSTDVLFYPITGRTHQLRVHSAHHLGLNRPITGDRLYGADTVLFTQKKVQNKRLHLHAMSITFCHPDTGESLTFSSKDLLYPLI